MCVNEFRGDTDTATLHVLAGMFAARKALRPATAGHGHSKCVCKNSQRGTICQVADPVNTGFQAMRRRAISSEITPLTHFA